MKFLRTVELLKKITLDYYLSKQCSMSRTLLTNRLSIGYNLEHQSVNVKLKLGTPQNNIFYERRSRVSITHTSKKKVK